MAIDVQCSECKARYRAGDEMAGRKVRCKHCGAVFTIAGGSPQQVISDTGAFRSVPDRDSHDTAAPGRSYAGQGAAPPPPSTISAPSDSEGGHPDDFFKDAFDSFRGPRSNVPYVYPYAAAVHQFLPVVLGLIAAIWLVSESMRSNENGPPWLGWARLGIFVAVYAAVVFPLSWLGVKRAAAKMKFELPQRPALRVFAGLALPFTLACALWLVSGGLSGFITGAIVGSMLACPIIWLVLRLRQREGSTTLSYTGGAFAASLVAGLLLLLGLNYGLIRILRTTQTPHTLVASPFGPGFAWDGPIGEAPPKKTAVVRGPAFSPPKTLPNATQPSTKPKPSPPDGRPSETQPMVQVPDGPRPDVVPDTPDPQKTQPISTPPEPDTSKVVPWNVEPGNGGTPPAKQNDDIIEKVRAAHLPFVKEVVALPQLGSFDTMIQPALPSSWVAILTKTGNGQEQLDAWGLNPLERTGSASFSSENNTPGIRYALSPDSDSFARIAQFPSLSAQVWSIKENNIIKRVELSKENGTPELVGFCAPDKFLIYWNTRQGPVLQVLATKGPPLGRKGVFKLPATYVRSPANGEISPDGKFFAFVAREKDVNSLWLCDLSGSVAPKPYRINALDSQWGIDPAGIAFSSDMSKVAVLIEHQGDAMISSWAVKSGGRAPNEPVLPFGVIPPGQVGPWRGARVFGWLGEKAWLVHGDAVLDADNGKLLGHYGLRNVRGQYVLNDDTCYLACDEGTGGRNRSTRVRLIVIKNDLDKLHAPSDSDPAPAGTE